MKLLKRILPVLLSVLLILSLSGCVVPYTYISIAGNYIRENKEDFKEYIQTIQEELNEYIPMDPAATSWNNSASDTETEPVPESEPETAESSESSESVTIAPESEEASSAETSENSAQTEKPDGNTAIHSSYVPEYVHYDLDDFEKMCDQFKEAGEDGDDDAVRTLYEELVSNLKKIATMNTVAFINFSIDVNNDYYDEEYSYCDKLYTDCFDLFMLSCQSVLKSKGAKAFKEIANVSIIEEAEEYEALTDTAKDLLEQETKLENRYNKEMDEVNSLTYEKGGQTYTFEMLYEDESELTMLALFNYNEFMEIYTGLLKAANDKLGPIYLELIDLRGKLAEEFGYDTYADYCYKETYGRGYTTKEAEQYCENIKKNVGSDYYQTAYYKIYNSTYFETEFSTDEMLDCLEKYTSKVCDLTTKAYENLTEKKLYDIGDGSGRYNGSYTTSIYSEGLPFIFSNIGGDLSGLSTLVHEFGHFTNDLYEEKDPDYFFCNGNYDVLEIHSNGLELMTANHFGDFVSEDEAEDALDYELTIQLNSVIEGCIYDEFQRKVYENTNRTLDEINDLYADICAQYGQPSLPGNEYMWTLINHNFESPMYYISYSVSALSALEIWTFSIKDEQKAIDVWSTVVKEKDDEDYDVVTKNAGLTPFTDAKGAADICSFVIDYINGDVTEADIAA